MTPTVAIAAGLNSVPAFRRHVHCPRAAGHSSLHRPGRERGRESLRLDIPRSDIPRSVTGVTGPISSHFFPFLQHNGRYTSPARPSLFTSTESSAQYLCLATDVGTLHLYCPFMSIYVLATDSLLLFIFVAGLARP